MPVVSIIVATYNSSKTLRAALQSVLEQSFQDWECIIVDGASIDNTLDIVKEFVQKDSRFRFVSEPDNGVYDAFNKGWKLAKGEWIHYLGSDDKLTKDGMSGLLKYSHDDVDVVSGHCYIEKIDGSLKHNYSHGFFGCHQGKLTRRKILEKFNGFNLKYPVLADKDLMLRMERNGVKITNVDTFVAFFSMTGISQDFKGVYKRTVEYFRVCRDNNLSLPLWLSAKYYIKSFASTLFRRIKSLFKCN